MTSSTVSPDRPAGAQAMVVWFGDELLWVRLADGRELGVPVVWFPRLAKATPAQREHWELIDQGFGIHWPDVDEDVSVLGLLGLPD